MELRPILSALWRSKTAPLLVALQVAISLAVMVNALHLVNLRLAAADRPSGIANENEVFYLVARPVGKMTHREILAEQDRTLQMLAALPGAVSVGWGTQMPMSRSGSSGSVRATVTQTMPSAEASIYFTQPGFVKTLGLQLVAGRDFQPGDLVERDGDGAWFDNFPTTAIVTRALAQALYPDAQDVVGREFNFGMGKAQTVRIVGVVDRLQTVQSQLGAEGEVSVLLPARLSTTRSRYVVRTAPGERDKVMAAAQEQLRKTAPVPLRIVARSVEEDRQNRYRNERALAWMLIAVTGLLLLVTISGIVGMTTLRVAQRRKQIGVRRALGARWRDILRYFLLENLLITGAGIVTGLVLAIAANQVLVRTLSLQRLPTGALLGSAAALLVLGVLAVWGPAWRAARISPAIATRTA